MRCGDSVQGLSIVTQSLFSPMNIQNHMRGDFSLPLYQKPSYTGEQTKPEFRDEKVGT